MIMHWVLQVVIALCLFVPAFEGFRDGIFASVYSACRTFFGAIVSLTFYQPLSQVIQVVFPRLSEHPGPKYVEAIVFPTLFALVLGFMRALKVRFTIPSVPSYPLADKIAGPVIGLFNGILIAGLLALTWSLMPFNKYMPYDSGRISERQLFWDPAPTTLKFYAWVCDRMPGRIPFLLYDEEIVADENGNGIVDADSNDAWKDTIPNRKWDRGAIPTYKRADEFKPEDVESVMRRK